MLSRNLFGELQGQEALVRMLSRALEADRLASALLFHGPAGVGKLTAALALCQCLLCERSAPAACGACDACRWIGGRTLLHPDVGLLWPQKKEDLTERESPTTVSGRDLHVLQEEVRRNAPWRILVGPARERLGELFLSPSRGRRRILLVLAAERLAEESGNALLKVLEEPPGGAVILLLSESPAALLPTIRSRCQACRFSPLPRRLVEEFLRQHAAAPDEEARLLAALSGGRIGLSLSLARDAETYHARRDALSRVVSRVRQEKTPAASLAGASEILAGETETMADLSILMDLLRDAMLLDCGCDASRLSDPRSTSLREELGLTSAEAAALLVRVERAREDLRRYVNRQVAVESLFLDLADPAPLREGRE